MNEDLKWSIAIGLFILVVGYAGIWFAMSVEFFSYTGGTFVGLILLVPCISYIVANTLYVWTHNDPYWSW